MAQIKQLQINDYLNQDGLPTTQSSGGISTGSVISLCKTDTWNQFASSLAAGDVRSAITLAQHLAGLGVGLTPTGDDFIMGTLYAARIIHPADIADQLAQATANAAAPLTTSLSAAWLRSAGKGEAGILWHELFDALLSSRRSQIQMSIDKILDVGATSGADALAGFLGTFISYVELQKKHVIP